MVLWARHKAAVYQWCEFKSRRGKNKNVSAQRSNADTVGFNFQTCVYIYVLGVPRPTSQTPH